MTIPNLTKKQIRLAHLVKERSSKVSSKDFVITRAELKKALGNNYLEVLELCSFIQYVNSGWTSSSEKWEANGHSLIRRDGTKANWKGKAKKFVITNREMLYELLNTPIPVKVVDKKAIARKDEAKKKAGQRYIKALPEYQQLQVQELRWAWKQSGNKLKDFFVSVNDGRYYSSVHGMSKEEREQAFVEKMGMREIDGKSFHTFILARQFFLETGDRSALDFLRSQDLYSSLSQKALIVPFSSVYQNHVGKKGFSRKTRRKGRTKKGTSLLAIPVSENTDHRERGKEIINHLTNAGNSVPGTEEAFNVLGLSKFYAFIQKLKKKSKKLSTIDTKKGLGVYCQEIEDKIIRKTIGKGLLEKGFRFIDLHDGFYTNAPDSEVEALLFGLPEISFSDFKVKAVPSNQSSLSLPNEKLPEAPEQIEAVLTPPKDFQASDGLLMAPRTSPEDFLKPLESLLLPPNPFLFQALDDFMNEIGLELNHIPEHDILEQEERLCQR